jgi:ketosteroid isomerase-like protein
MSEENVEVVRHLYESFSLSDWDRITQLADPNIEYHGTIGGLEEGRIARGPEQIRLVFEEDDLEAWAERRLEPEEFIDAGNEVVVLQREYRRGRGSGVELATDTAAVIEVRDGRVVRIQGYMSRAAALEAVGFSEQGACNSASDNKQSPQTVTNPGGNTPAEQQP